jgi:hypothetical protein
LKPHVLLHLLLGHCSQYARLTAKVKDIVFVATIKIMLAPLVEKVPGFGEGHTCFMTC